MNRDERMHWGCVSASEPLTDKVIGRLCKSTKTYGQAGEEKRKKRKKKKSSSGRHISKLPVGDVTWIIILLSCLFACLSPLPSISNPDDAPALCHRPGSNLRTRGSPLSSMSATPRSHTLQLYWVPYRVWEIIAVSIKSEMSVPSHIAKFPDLISVRFFCGDNYLQLINANWRVVCLIVELKWLWGGCSKSRGVKLTLSGVDMSTALLLVSDAFCCVYIDLFRNPRVFLRKDPQI